MSREKNNFGILRLVLASCVIIGHAPEQIDGNRSREPLTVIFHTVSLGGLAVTGFFLLSGFLITKSAENAPSISNYLSNRLRRIVPGYLVAYALCVFALAPLVGGTPFFHLKKIATNSLLLQPPPNIPGALAGLPIPALNGAMWSIAYEFRCYLLIGALSVTGLISKRWTILATTIMSLVASVAVSFVTISAHIDKEFRNLWWLFGLPSQTINLTAIFLVGACFYLFRDKISNILNWKLAVASAAVLLIGLNFIHIASISAAVFGGILIFWIALESNLGILQQINDKWDISYGTYLYGWPVAITILYYSRNITPLLLSTTTLPIALTFGALSWFLIEKPAKSAFRTRFMGAGRHVLE
jgi:peptidoglycan/LPS O-acetylase OafA/YrhL